MRNMNRRYHSNLDATGEMPPSIHRALQKPKEPKFRTVLEPPQLQDRLRSDACGTVTAGTTPIWMLQNEDAAEHFAEHSRIPR